MTFKVYFTKDGKKFQIKVDARDIETAKYLTKGRFGDDIEIKKVVPVTGEFDILNFLKGFHQ